MAVDENNALGEKGSSIITLKFYGCQWQSPPIMIK